MKTYIITERAGPYVAGRRVGAIEPGTDGKRRVELSEACAAFDVASGAIEPEPATPAEPGPEAPATDDQPNQTEPQTRKRTKD